MMSTLIVVKKQLKNYTIIIHITKKYVKRFLTTFKNFLIIFLIKLFNKFYLTTIKILPNYLLFINNK